MTTHALLQPEDLKPAVELANRALAQLDQVLLGRSQLHRMVMAGILSRGHILLEGLPGVGKDGHDQGPRADSQPPVPPRAVYTRSDAQRHSRDAHSARGRPAADVK